MASSSSLWLSMKSLKLVMSAWAFSRAWASKPAWMSSSWLTSSMTCSWLRFRFRSRSRSLGSWRGFNASAIIFALHLIELRLGRFLVLRSARTAPSPASPGRRGRGCRGGSP